ncbi:HAD family phosphatase [Simkania negevensis]|uniref:HAD family phosphatase n=1 Tax=Simkania negevensis TaxID=83561 RepID=A0ABS3APS6_9BACT|nr:HAD family phosphatase [Simkania negevensis]
MDKKVLFLDLDGTIANSLPKMFELFTDLLAPYGVTATDEEFRSLLGPSVAEIVATVREKHNIEQSNEELYHHYITKIEACYNEEIELFPGVVEFLDFASQRQQKVCLVTSAPKSLSHSFLQSKGILPYFYSIYTAEDTARRKPHPDIYQLALHNEQYTPEQAITVEDSPQGITASVAAGIDTIAIHAHNECNTNGLLASVDNWHELLAFAKGKWSQRSNIH